MEFDIKIVLYITVSLLVLIVLFFVNQRKSLKSLKKVKELTKEINTLKKHVFDKDIALSSYKNVKQTSLITSEIQKREILENEITRLKRVIKDTQAIAEDASMAKSEFLTNIRHEIRTPMNSILVFSEMLEKTLQDKQLMTYANNIFNSGHNLLQLLNNIIELSEIEAGGFEMETHGIDTKSYMDEVLVTHRGEANRRNLKLLLEISDDMPESILIDNIRVKEILDNLIENALKFTKEGEVKVLVSLDSFNKVRNEADISISVIDTGMGIAKENLEKIFRIFESRHSTTAIDYNGTGLGLSINRKLARLMDGNLEVFSEYSVGSTFTLTLNNVEVILASLAKDIDESTLDFSLIQKKNIAVIDDEQASLEEIESCFRDTDAKISSFPNTRAGITFLQNNEIDLLIINIDILTMEDGAVSKVLAKMISAPVVTLVHARLKNFHFPKDGIQPVGHLKKPLKKVDLFSVLLKVINSQQVKVDEDSSIKIEDHNVLSFDRNKLASDAYFENQTDEIDKLLSEALKTNDLDIIKRFALSVDKLSKIHDVITLKKFAHELLEKVEFFEIESIDKMLKEYQIKAREYRRT